MMYFWDYRLPMTWLDKYRKTSVSEDPSKSSMVNGANHCSKLNGRTFTKLIDPSEGNLGWNTLSDDKKYSLLNKDNLL